MISNQIFISFIFIDIRLRTIVKLYRHSKFINKQFLIVGEVKELFILYYMDRFSLSFPFYVKSRL